MLRERRDMPWFSYDIWPGNGAGLLFQPGAYKASGCRSTHGAEGVFLWVICPLYTKTPGTSVPKISWDHLHVRTEYEKQ